MDMDNDWIIDLDLCSLDEDDHSQDDEGLLNLDLYISDANDSDEDDDSDEDNEMLLDLDIYPSDEDEEEDGPLSDQMVESFQRLLYNDNMEEEGNRTKCTICQCDLEAGDTIIYLPACLDKFHEDCIISSFKFSSKCPNCRTQY